MNVIDPLLFSLADHTQSAAASLHQAMESCRRFCVTEISDLHRQSISELSDIERRFYRGEKNTAQKDLAVAYRLTDCIHHAFSAAMLIPDDLPFLPPLCDVAGCNETLSQYPRMLFEHRPIDFFSMHTVANKGRGAHALLVSHYCTVDGGKHLLPLSYAMEAFRNVLEDTCEQLLLEIG